ncbi:MAG TPA: hypothetical protein VGC56_12465 [Allosphingosinicella sp.]|jgi:hypothetical protein
MAASPITTIERAFELARSGRFASVSDIRLALRRERFDQVEAHLAGSSIARQLRALCDEARRGPAAAAPEASEDA